MKNLLLFISVVCLHATGVAQVFATVEEVSGLVTVVLVDGSSAAAVVGQKLLVGQTVVTQADGELHAITEDNGVLALRPNSVFKVSRYAADQSSNGSNAVVEISLLKGALRSITGWIGKLNPRGYRITTSTATIGVRGTDHETTVIEVPGGVDPPGTYDTVYEGATVVRSPQGEIELQTGQHGFATADGQPPRMLKQQPGFYQKRMLRLEHRIQARKDRMREHIRQFTLAHPARAAEIRAKLADMTDEQKEALREKRMHPARHPR